MFAGDRSITTLASLRAPVTSLACAGSTGANHLAARHNANLIIAILLDLKLEALKSQYSASFAAAK